VALEAVRQASRVCRAVQGALGPDVLEKRDRSPVTVADFGSQALVCRVLEEAFPGDPVIAEEDSAALREPDNAALQRRVVEEVARVRQGAAPEDVLGWIDRGGATEASDRFWALDPIDGTKGFLRGDQYAVALALVVDGQVVVAALGCPNLPLGDAPGALFGAVRGRGAFQQPLEPPPGVEGTREPVRVSAEADPRRIRFCESVEAAHSSHGDAARVAERLAIEAAPVRLDSQAKYAVVARGEAEAYLRLPKSADYVEKIWDHAAGWLVVSEAGGRVSDIRGRALEFHHGRTLAANRGVIVAADGVHDAILGAITYLGIE
jgi:3'(2'), 5'-bisphosphate nucleotidase